MTTLVSIPPVTALLSEAFDRDPHVLWFIGNPKSESTRKRRIRALMNYMCRATRSSNSAFVSDDGRGAALWRRDSSVFRGIGYIAANLRYLFTCGIKATVRSLRMEKIVAQKMPHGPYLFLWTVGIQASARGKGILRELVAPLLSESDDNGIPVYLETTVERNVEIYRHYGFELVETYSAYDSPLIYFMRRNPSESQVMRSPA
jgi:GNAT superfamily N-acetyltransferase